jgi:hypothetical protein
VCARRVLRLGPAVEVVRSPVAKRRDARQRALLFDPMPERVEPCLALLAAKVPTGVDWAYEVKWDGYRLAVHVEPGQVRVITRGGRLDPPLSDNRPRCARAAARQRHPRRRGGCPVGGAEAACRGRLPRMDR